MVMDEDSDFGRFAHDEAKALLRLLETPERKVLVLVVAVQGDEIMTLRVPSENIRADQASAMLEGVERSADKIGANLAEARP